MQVTYGIGGFLPDKPGQNIVRTDEDFGDGTGEVVYFDDAGNETSRERLTGLPIPEPEPEPESTSALSPEKAAELDAAARTATTVAGLRTVLRNALAALAEAPQ